MKFDAQRARLQGSDTFVRFRVSGDGTPLGSLSLDPETALLLFERCGETRALLVREMVYHHAAQGELAGEPYLVSF